MPPPHSLLSLLLLPLLTQATTTPSQTPTAIKKLPPDAGVKIFPEHLAFAFLLQDQQPHSRAYAPHYPDSNSESNPVILPRRAAAAANDVLSILQRRSTCPLGMNSCSNIGSPNKCCQEGTYCTEVTDTEVGHVACCPVGSTCGGGVGQCPYDAVSCPASLGGGCCIAGYVCQGIGCVLAQPSSTAAETITTTQTTIIQGEPSTVIVTLTITRFPTDPTTQTAIEIITAPNTATDETGAAPWRPTITDTQSASSNPQSSSPKSALPADVTSQPQEPTQEGCPAGFYGCLATHGGGCCQTDRICQVHSCPPVSSTTIISEGVTVVVPAHNVPATITTSTAACATGWFMCGSEGGPEAGCCPTGYDCGTASCFAAEATGTGLGRVQKERPGSSDAVSDRRGAVAVVLLAALSTFYIGALTL